MDPVGIDGANTSVDHGRANPLAGNLIGNLSAKLDSIVTEMGKETPEAPVVPPATEVAPVEAAPAQEAAPSEAEPPAAEVAPTPEAATPPPPDPAILAAKEVIVRLGGDPDKPETWAKTLDQVKDETPLPVSVDPSIVATEVQKILDTDPQVRQVDQTFQVIVSDIQGMEKGVRDLAAKLDDLNARMKYEAKDDLILRDQLREDIRDVRYERDQIRQQLAEKNSERQKCLDWFLNVKKQLQRSKERELTDQAAYEQAKQLVEQRASNHVDRFKVEWPTTFDKLVKEFKLTPEDAADLHTDLAAHARANPEPTYDIPKFMRPHFERFSSRVVRHHAAKSAEYGQRAVQRTQAVAGTSPASKPEHGASPDSNKTITPASRMAAREKSFADKISAMLGG